MFNIVCDEDIAKWISEISPVENFVKNDTIIQRIFAHVTDGEYDSLFLKVTFCIIPIVLYSIVCIVVQEHY